MAGRVVKREDIERYRQALTELGGEASLEQVAVRTGETHLDYIAACLIVPEPTEADPTIIFPFAIPSAVAYFLTEKLPEAQRSSEWEVERVVLDRMLSFPEARPEPVS